MEYQYPQDFPQASRDKVEQAKILAGRKFDLIAKASLFSKHSWISAAPTYEGFRNYVLTPVLVFFKEGAGLRRWPVDVMRAYGLNFLNSWVEEAFRNKGEAAGLLRNDWSGDGNFIQSFKLMETIQWRKCEDILLEIAQDSLGASVPAATNRHTVIDNFISKATAAAAGRRITRKDFWTVAGYTDKTEFERFQRDDDRTTASATTTFERVLKMQPDEFVKNLEDRERKASQK
jgi:hypothetical protein